MALADVEEFAETVSRWLVELLAPFIREANRISCQRVATVSGTCAVTLEYRVTFVRRSIFP